MACPSSVVIFWSSELGLMFGDSRSIILLKSHEFKTLEAMTPENGSRQRDKVPWITVLSDVQCAIRFTLMRRSRNEKTNQFLVHLIMAHLMLFVWIQLSYFFHGKFWDGICGTNWAFANSENWGSKKLCWECSLYRNWNHVIDSIVKMFQYNWYWWWCNYILTNTGLKLSPLPNSSVPIAALV